MRSQQQIQGLPEYEGKERSNNWKPGTALTRPKDQPLVLSPALPQEGSSAEKNGQTCSF